MAPFILHRADRFLGRLAGLLARPPLQAGEGLLLVPCAAIHTAFLGYALDIVFLDRDGVVLKVEAGLRPWRAAACAGAWQTLELAAGEAARRGWMPGCRLDHVLKEHQP